MRRPDPAPRPHPAAAAAVAAATVALLLALVALPVAAKEGLQATFDAPVAMDTPPGTVVVVGIQVMVPTDEGLMPVVGSPVYLKLLGRNGAATREAAAGDRAPGHYTVTIAIPDGGARGVEVGIHGTSDLPMMVLGETLVAGGVRAGTAQVAPPSPAAVRPPAAAAEPAAPDPDPAAGVQAAAPVPASPWDGAGLPAAAIVVGCAGAAVLLVAARRRAGGERSRAA